MMTEKQTGDPFGLKVHIRRRQGGEVFTDHIHLIWEAELAFISDNFSPDETSAQELLRMWVQRLVDGGDGYLPDCPLYWFIGGPVVTCEEALLARNHLPVPRDHQIMIGDRFYSGEWLGYNSWPTDDGGQRIQLTRLPVVDLLWRPGRSDKGGFIQDSTGWKPSAFQPYVDVPALLIAAGYEDLLPAKWRCKERM